MFSASGSLRFSHERFDHPRAGRAGFGFRELSGIVGAIRRLDLSIRDPCGPGRPGQPPAGQVARARRGI